ncbi:MAG: hypothetical protein AB7P76_00175 [Candidatus Melainabacteria bacterium]
MNVMFGSSPGAMCTNRAQNAFSAKAKEGMVLFGCSQDAVSFGKRGPREFEREEDDEKPKFA